MARSPQRFLVPPLLVLTVAVVHSSSARPGGDSGDLQLRDRIVAVVDEDPILRSEVEEAIALSLAEPAEGETDESLRQRVVDQLVDQRLRFHAVERSGFERVSVAEVEERVEAIVARFEDRAAFEQRLGELGMTEAELRQLVARQVAILNYVDERLGARVFVSVDDIREHYRDELTPELRRRGEEVPPLAEVREVIRDVLQEQRLNEEIERWTEELRREADVLRFVEPPGELPPVVYRSEESPAAGRPAPE